MGRCVATIVEVWRAWIEEGRTKRARGSGARRRTTNRQDRHLRLLALRDRERSIRAVVDACEIGDDMKSDIVSPTYRFDCKFTVNYPTWKKWGPSGRRPFQGRGPVLHTDDLLTDEASEYDDTMPPKRSREEILRRKREAEKTRMLKIKNDPIKLAEYKEKEKQKQKSTRGEKKELETQEASKQTD
ncbi:unnamed protein product [Callosobruchus maculatus]|uniref:Uncharacterized protein n=1 Tax=Callosobruchus maculatus TaxID=64391 RepID=A0A653C6D1_CALMS|nr:unnamed protein product [Callosobruchus maculatus]